MYRLQGKDPTFSIPWYDKFGRTMGFEKRGGGVFEMTRLFQHGATYIRPHFEPYISIYWVSLCIFLAPDSRTMPGYDVAVNISQEMSHWKDKVSQNM